VITVGIVTHNRREALARLLTSPHYEAALPDGALTLVLDQASDAATAAWLRMWAKEARDRRRVWHTGIVDDLARARQWLVDFTSTTLDRLREEDVMVFLDDDIEPIASGWLAELLAALERPDVQIAGAGGWRITPDWLVEPAPHVPGLVDYVGGGWCAVRGAVFQAVRFDRDFVRCYWEDADLCLPVRALGGLVWGCGDIGLVHHSESDGAQHAWQEINRARMRAKWGQRYA